MAIAKLRSEIHWWFLMRWPFLPVWFINLREDILDWFMNRRLDDYRACQYLVEQAMREGSSAGQAHRIATRSGFWDITIRPARHEDVYDGSSISSFCSWDLK